MMLVSNFKNLNKNDSAIAGGKGASLGELTQAGIPVPPGFVILSDSFEQFIKETDLVQEIDSILGKVNHKEIHTVEFASEQIKDLIIQREIPNDIANEIKKHFKELDTKYVAVRSSATAEDGAEHAWAGQLESYLNTTEIDLLDKVKHCWASLFTPRAIFYRFEKGLHTTKISVAVVVQKMVASEISGIVFSVHPITEDYNQLIIEAGFGLGEAIVSGSITPDSYVVEKEPRQIIDINVNNQKKGLYRKDNGGNEWKDIPEQQGASQVLNKQQILELSEIILNIENHYGFPCDIEWAFENGKFYIVQSRPITTLSGKRNVPKQTFVKAYTRNFSIIMQQAWFAANKENLIQKLDLKEYPYNPPYLYFMKDGVEEVWENTRANRWLLDRLIERLKSDKDFFLDVHKRYFDRLPIVEKWWNKEIKTVDELKEFLKLVYEGVSDFVILYAALMDDNVPQEYQELSNKFREKDVFFAECNTAIWKGLNNIYPDFGYLAVYITKEELGEEISRDELVKRDAGFVLIPGVFVGPLSFDELVQKFPEYHFKIEKGEHDFNGLKGEIAYKGKVRGIVRIVKRKDQIEQMQEGEIIVSPMTTPDMVPAMKKAIAFVTDEGGITCHAAIIAREMQKPCIIGTKVATEILKDGDEIEVDADNGVIKVISQQQAYNPSNYIRMFAGKSFPYLFSNIFLNYYNALGVVSIQGDGTWMSFFPKDLVEKTNQEGTELYTSKKNYKKYKEEFDNYIDTSRKYFESVIKKDTLTSEDTERFFQHVSNLFTYYSKTEFFYTDGIDQSKMVISVKEFDELKLGGRAYLNSLFFESEGYIKSFIRKIAKQIGVNEADLLNYNVTEIANLLENGNQINSEEVQSRSTFFESKDTILFGSSAKQLISNFFSNYLQISDVIKGTIANKGKVKGKARVLVPDAKDFDKIAYAVKEMEEGEILIAETTSPDIIAACKKAAAIVTNQGGQLSHAAIVSRELGIPCIIGTDKDVILNIKTGDLVEVNADEGVIHIIK